MRDDLGDKFVSRLEGLMVEHGLSTAEKLAWFVGVSRGTAYTWLKGNGLPSLEGALLVSRAFSVSIDWLAGETEIRAKPPATAEEQAGPERGEAYDRERVAQAHEALLAHGRQVAARRDEPPEQTAQTPGRR